MVTLLVPGAVLAALVITLVAVAAAERRVMNAEDAQWPSQDWPEDGPLFQPLLQVQAGNGRRPHDAEVNR